MNKLFFWVVVGILVLPQAMAMSVISRGDGTVFIQNAISASGTQPMISLTRVMRGGQPESVPLKDAKSIQVERRGLDIILTGFSKGDGYRDVLIQRREQGSQQMMRIGVSGSHSSGVVQSSLMSLSHRSGARPDIRRGPQASPPQMEQSIINKRFVNRQMSGANFRLANIVNAHFDQVNLTGADFSRASLVNVRYQKSNLSAVDFRQSRVVNIRFQQVNLQGSNFQGAHLTAVDFQGSDLSGAIWTDGRRCLPGSVGKCRLN